MARWFSLSNIPNVASEFLVMIINLIPEPLRAPLQFLFHSLFPRFSELTLVFDELIDNSRNEFYDATDLYLAIMLSAAVQRPSAKTEGPSPQTEGRSAETEGPSPQTEGRSAETEGLSPETEGISAETEGLNAETEGCNAETKVLDLSKTRRLRLSKAERQGFRFSIDNLEKVKDDFEGIELKWSWRVDDDSEGPDKKFFELTFKKKFQDRVVKRYLPHVLDTAKKIKEESKVIKIYSLRVSPHSADYWVSRDLEHPATFDTIAMVSADKKMIIDDLERFRSRRDLYKRVGKAWKRGYLLYGPPGTGKSSLVAAMANHLKFDVYDLELARIRSDSELRTAMSTVKNRSIIVIEDIDCCPPIEDREMAAKFDRSFEKLTISGILNSIDGVWSSSADERVIVFTTNHKERVDPVLLRPGRMDKHIEMSYCTVEGFRILARNYLGINEDHLSFGEIDKLIKNTKVTPAEVAEELISYEDEDKDTDLAMQRLVEFIIKNKRSENTMGVREEDVGCRAGAKSTQF